nr:DNA polymerase III subunit epsilon [Paracoccus sp. Z118]
MIREIVFDTETTGFDPATGDRVVEIGAVELINHLPTGNRFHVYLNPDRAMPAEAMAVHGLSDEFLRDKPRFGGVVAEFLAFIGTDCPMIAHNADFDFRFLNAELRRCGHPPLHGARAVDTAAMARQKFPGAPASLDALCRRFGVDNSGRELHGALLDSELLAEVYLELIGGRQPDLVLDAPAAETEPGATVLVMTPRRARPRPLPPRLTEAETQAHAAFVARMGEKAVWLRLT